MMSLAGSASAQTTPVRVLVAHGHCLTREAITAAVETQEDLEVVHRAADIGDLESQNPESSPNVAVIDGGLPGGPEKVICSLLAKFPDCQVLVVGHDDEDEALCPAVLAGARGYLRRGESLPALIAGIHALARGEAVIPPEKLGDLLGRLIRRRGESDATRRVVGRLTVREREVLRLVTEGHDNSSIGRSLVISPQTARTHVQNVLGKLGVHSRLEAAAFVLRHGVHEDLQAV